MRLECHNTDSVSNWPIDSECEYNNTGAEFLLSEHALSFTQSSYVNTKCQFKIVYS